MKRLEDGTAIAAMAAMVALPLVEVGGRALGGPGVPGAIVLVQHLTLWIAMAGAALAARSDRLLALSTPRFLPERWRHPTLVFTTGVAAGISATLVRASVDFVRVERTAGDTVALEIPLWWILSVLPVGFVALTIRLIWSASGHARGRSIAALGLALPLLLAVAPSSLQPALATSSLVVILAATALGLPIFAAIGGAALVLFWADATPLSAVPVETYLMPPMGENLFLSSYRFKRPLTEVYRSTLPYTVILLATVLLITYVPSLTLWLVAVCKTHGWL